MANTPDVSELAACREPASARLPIDPWRSLAVHFGMLLGVEDFRVIDTYHRGKMWLHAAWLHREGVIWGFAPSFDDDAGELRIEPGLALDARGRELHLERAACLDLGEWFAARQQQLAGVVEQLDDGRVRLDAHIRARFVGCLDRSVPALVEPCEGAGQTTAYSRVFETIELELAEGLPEPRAAAYPRLRMLFGLEPIDPQLDDAAEIQAARAEILAATTAERPSVVERAFQRFAARDAAALHPSVDDEGIAGLLPVAEPAGLVLAEIDGLTLRPDGDSWQLDSYAQLRWDRRPTHVATRPLQDLIAAAGASASASASGTTTNGAGPEPRGVRILRDSVAIGPAALAFEFDGSIEPASFGCCSLSLSAFVPGSGWRSIAITEVCLDESARQVQAQHGPLPKCFSRLRLRVDGTSDAPILGVDGWPLAGADDEREPSSAHFGRNFVHMQFPQE